MTKNNFLSKDASLKLCALFLFPCALFGGVALSNNSNRTQADSVSYAYSHSDEQALANSSFQTGANPHTREASFSGWSALPGGSNATSLMINVGNEETSDENTETTFSKYQSSTYMLKENPGFFGTNDSRILMINSKQSTTDTSNTPASKGFSSAKIDLNANAYYTFSVAVKTALNGDDNVSASVYLSGLVDDNNNKVNVACENISTSSWKTYKFYVATGDKAQTVTLDLFLGSHNSRSNGAVFFDEIKVVRHSENDFFDECYSNAYAGNDTFADVNSDQVFVVNALQSVKYHVEDLDNHNFDFEAPLDGTSLGSKWHTIQKQNAKAEIMDLDYAQPSDFAQLTGYGYTGTDLSYNNAQALVLWTTQNSSSSSFIGVKSDPIKIEAHMAYKISLQMKVSNIEEGSFYVKLSENDYIYTYSHLTDDEEETTKTLYTKQSGKTSGYTSNADDDWKNDYQTIEFYLKGHSLYNSEVELELWLGDSENEAQGCVVIDNITVEYATNNEVSSASNALVLSSYTGSSTTFKNNLFDLTEIDNTTKTYPLKATDWTSQIESEDYNTSGIIYVGSEDEYKSMYANKYTWAGITPSTQSGKPNNVYMMFNSTNSYQSLKSTNYTLSKDSYYKISFDYYNQLFGDYNPSQIKVEVIDENGITLFSQSGLSSLDSWNKMNILVHTAETVSNNVYVVIHLGENTTDGKVGGLVYLDNFNVESSTSTAFANAGYKADLTDYYFNLTTDGEIAGSITSTSAYKFEKEESYDNNYTTNDSIAIGGIVNGQNNVYDITTQNSNFLAITTRTASRASLTSNFNFNFEGRTDAPGYYVLTFDLATLLNTVENSDEHTCDYGVQITIDGYEVVKNLRTSSELKEFKIYFKTTDSITPTIKFTLLSDCQESVGTALLTNLQIKTTTDEIYNNLENLNEYGKTSFITNKANVVEEETTPDKDTTTDETTSNNSNVWILASSLITGLALIIAIAGYFLRKIKIKKIEKAKIEAYDRKIRVNYDAIYKKAQERRDAEVKNLQAVKVNLIEEKKLVEDEFSKFVKSNKEGSLKSLLTPVKATIKKYNSQISSIDERINIIKEKIDYVMSADYILTIERKIVAEEEEKLHKEKKLSKANKKR